MNGFNLLIEIIISYIENRRIVFRRQNLDDNRPSFEDTRSSQAECKPSFVHPLTGKTCDLVVSHSIVDLLLVMESTLLKKLQPVEQLI